MPPEDQDPIISAFETEIAAADGYAPPESQEAPAADEEASESEGSLTDEDEEEAGGSEESEDEESNDDEENSDDSENNPDGDSEESDEDSEGQEEEPDGADDRPRSFRWNIDGEEVEITEEEARLGYLRHRDYTQKTTQVAEERRKAEQEIAQKQQQAAELLQVALFHSQGDLAKFSKVDFQALERDDPAEAERLRSEYLKTAQKHAELEQLRQRLTAEQQQYLQKQALERRQAELEKARLAIPELADETKAKEYTNQLTAYAQSVGLTPEEVAGIADHRHLILLDKARRYDELMQKRDTAKKKVPPVKKRVVKPGSAATNKKPSKRSELQAKLAKQAAKGRTSDDVSIELFHQLLNED